MSSTSLIDVILTLVNRNKIINAGVIDVGISDHLFVYVSRKVGVPKESPKLFGIRQFKHFNRFKFPEDLRSAFLLFNKISDPKLAWEYWKSKFLDISNKHAPTRLRRVKCEYKPWLTVEINKLSNNRDYLKRKAIRLKSQTYNGAYKKCGHKHNRLIKKKADYYISKLLNAKNLKESWKIINELSNRRYKTTNIKEIHVDGRFVTEEVRIAENFNEYFSNIGPTLADIQVLIL